MMTENMKKLIEMVSASEDLKAKLGELGKQAGEDKEKAKALLTAFAQEQGITLTDEDFSPDNAELSADELQAVAGGSCIIISFSSEDYWDKAFSCVLSGLAEHDWLS